MSALGEIGGKVAIAALTSELNRPSVAGIKVEDYGDSEAIVRSHAANSLGKCGGADVLPLLERIRQDNRQFIRVRVSAQNAISQISKRYPQASLPKSAPPPNTQGDNKEIVSQILDRFHSPKASPSEKEDAVRALGFFGGEQANALFVTILKEPMTNKPDINTKDASAFIRVRAAMSLGQSGDESVLPLLKSLAADDKQYPIVRQACNEAIRAIQFRRGIRGTGIRETQY